MRKERQVEEDINKNAELENLKLSLEKQIAAGVWIQAIGQLIEVINLSKLFLISQEDWESPGEKQIVAGVWLATIGKIVEAIGVSEQILTTDKGLKLQGQQIAVTGDWIQTFGTALEAIGGTEVLSEEQVQIPTYFVP